MLTELRISNFALIDQLHLEFPPGFLVFTGETGAGKSLLIDALVLLTGGRASAEHIRFGADEALLEACFVLPPTHPLTTRLQQDGYLLPDQQDIIVRRMLSRSGKNRSFLNGQLAPLQTIQDIGPQLVDIHGQHDQQSLLSPKTQLKLLDAFGNLEEVVGRYQGMHREWVEKKAALDDYVVKLRDQANRQDILQYQYDELVKMQLQAGEEETLRQEYHRLKHSGRLGELSNQAFTALHEGDQPVLDQLGEVTEWIHELAQIDAQGETWVPLLESATVLLREVTNNLRDYRSQMEYDPERMEVIDSRLAGLQRLKKKYGKSIEELVELTNTLEQDLALLQDGEERVAHLQAEVISCYESIKALAEDLSARRKKVAKDLLQEIKQELAALKMATMEVQINIEMANADNLFGSAGMDRVDMLLAPNPGEPLMPLGRIASGGELSRIMLALKTVFAGNDQTPVVIFDEIDSGIGGEAGMVMGSRLRLLAQFHQVCCITHLPQIASQAHAQFVVEKTMVDDRTLTKVQEVTGVQRETEIARMLGGGTLTPTIRKTAAEMLDRGSKTNIGADLNKPKRKSAKI
ncbi:MAG: DNA repair protein RecN [Nitrospirae bacterium CG_4_9_14_3_um_filter_51_5]|nr:MAG: DNA repair protein RecN [Nitrospirae bacterium CG_4_9_14_3_um_filter_51_5]